MGVASKPMSKDFNSKHTTRNNKAEIFSKFTKSSETSKKASKKTVEPPEENTAEKVDLSNKES